MGARPRADSRCCSAIIVLTVRGLCRGASRCSRSARSRAGARIRPARVTIARYGFPRGMARTACGARTSSRFRVGSEFSASRQRARQCDFLSPRARRPDADGRLHSHIRRGHASSRATAVQTCNLCDWLNRAPTGAAHHKRGDRAYGFRRGSLTQADARPRASRRVPDGRVSPQTPARRRAQGSRPRWRDVRAPRFRALPAPARRPPVP